jgi:hypothetical protein
MKESPVRVWFVCFACRRHPPPYPPRHNAVLAGSSSILFFSLECSESFAETDASKNEDKLLDVSV